MTPRPIRFRDHAYAYAERGHAVVAISSKSKRPLLSKEWCLDLGLPGGGVDSATSDKDQLDQIIAYVDAHDRDARTAILLPHEIMVLDIDRHEGGADGLAYLRGRLGDGCQCAGGCTCGGGLDNCTCNGGCTCGEGIGGCAEFLTSWPMALTPAGAHVFMAAEDGWRNWQLKSLSDKGQEVGLDIKIGRCALNVYGFGYDTHTHHASRNALERAIADPQPAPAWLKQLAEPPKPKPPPTQHPLLPARSPNYQRQLDGWVADACRELAAMAPESGRNSKLNRLAYSLRHWPAAERDDAYAMLEQAAMEAGLRPSDIAGTLRSAGGAA